MNATLIPSSATPQSCLASSPIPELRRLIVEATEEVIIISGNVSSYYVKQMAQESVRPAIGPRRILNRVTVRR